MLISRELMLRCREATERARETAREICIREDARGAREGDLAPPTPDTSVTTKAAFQILTLTMWVISVTEFGRPTEHGGNL